MGRSRKNNRRSIRKVSRKPRNHSKFVKPNFSSEAVAVRLWVEWQQTFCKP